LSEGKFLRFTECGVPDGDPAGKANLYHTAGRLRECERELSAELNTTNSRGWQAGSSGRGAADNSFQFSVFSFQPRQTLCRKLKADLSPQLRPAALPKTEN
jgi:hypothetical protein